MLITEVREEQLDELNEALWFVKNKSIEIGLDLDLDELIALIEGELVRRCAIHIL